MCFALELFIVVHACVVSLVDACLGGKCKATSTHHCHVQAKEIYCSIAVAFSR